MSNFGSAQEAGDGSARKVYTGVENFRITSVCPDHEQLKKIFGENAKADDYNKPQENDGEPNVPQVKLVFYIDNEAIEDEESIKTRLTYFVTKQPYLTNAGDKTQYINVYGRTCWLTPDQAKSTEPIITLTGAKGAYHFDTAGMRPAYRGEDGVIDMLKNLLNLGSPDKAKDKSLCHAQFSTADWEAMFNGNFASIRSAVTSSPNKIGLLLGAKTVADGSVYQDVYNRSTLRQYSKGSGNFKYIRSNVESAQENGSYPNTNFGDPSYKLAEFLGDAVPTPQAAVSTGFGQVEAPKFDAATTNAFTPQG